MKNLLLSQIHRAHQGAGVYINDPPDTPSASRSWTSTDDPLQLSLQIHRAHPRAGVHQRPPRYTERIRELEYINESFALGCWSTSTLSDALGVSGGSSTLQIHRAHPGAGRETCIEQLEYMKNLPLSQIHRAHPRAGVHQRGTTSSVEEIRRAAEKMDRGRPNGRAKDARTACEDRGVGRAKDARGGCEGARG